MCRHGVVGGDGRRRLFSVLPPILVLTVSPTRMVWQGNVTQDSQAYYYSICEGCDLWTGDYPAEGNGTQQCIAALANTKSTGIDDEGVSITLETLTISLGYWRATASTATIRPCWNDDACRGGITGNAAYCAEGYRGPCELVHVNDALDRRHTRPHQAFRYCFNGWSSSALLSKITYIWSVFLCRNVRQGLRFSTDVSP